MQLHFNKESRGPGWEKWMIVELQHGDAAYAGQIIITYSDSGRDTRADCDIMLTREPSEEEIDQLMDSVTSLLCGYGLITLHAGPEVAAREFCLLDHDHEAEN